MVNVLSEEGEARNGDNPDRKFKKWMNVPCVLADRRIQLSHQCQRHLNNINGLKWDEREAPAHHEPVCAP